MKEFFDYDPLTGATEYFDFDPETGTATIETVQDVESALEQCRESRNNGLRDHGIKESWFHYADIPLVYLLKLRKIGVSWDDPKEMNRAINTYFPELKMTNKNDGGKVGQTFLPNRTVEAAVPASDTVSVNTGIILP